MKINIDMEIDCTPQEARKFFGLPDVEPLQAATMAKLEQRISDELDRFSPDALMKSWFAVFPQSELMRMFENVLGRKSKRED